MYWLIVPYMAWLSRMSGGGWPKLPLGLDQWCYALPYLLICWPVAGLWSILPYICAVMGKRTGHGGFMDLGRWKRKRDEERLEFIIRHLKGKIPDSRYDFIGLAITGVSVSFVPVLVLLASNPVHSFVLLVSGAAKAVAYWIGWEFAPNPTETGEVLTGAFAGLGIALILTLF